MSGEQRLVTGIDFKINMRDSMIKQIALMLSIVALFGLLGFFINPLFYYGIMILCPLMHFLMGREMHGGNNKKKHKKHAVKK